MANENGQTGYPLLVQDEAAGIDFLTSIIPTYAMQQAPILTEFRLKLQNFTERLNKLPPSDSVDNTPDGKAFTILISHIEMTLDEMFFGLWETYDFKWSVIANEVVGSIVLEVIHPVTGEKVRRTGAAAIQIMVDKVPEDVAKDSVKRNEWANNPANKKPAALDMGFPKLKAECTKNAAQSFGKLFGRDINRGLKADNYKALQKDKSAAATKATKDALLKQAGNGQQ